MGQKYDVLAKRFNGTDYDTLYFVGTSGKEKWHIKIFRKSQEWTFPANAKPNVHRICVSGGAGGCGTIKQFAHQPVVSPVWQNGAGGGSGLFAEGDTTLLPGYTYEITIGEGGAPGINVNSAFTSGMDAEGGGSTYGFGLAVSGGEPGTSAYGWVNVSDEEDKTVNTKGGEGSAGGASGTMWIWDYNNNRGNYITGTGGDGWDFGGGATGANMSWGDGTSSTKGGSSYDYGGAGWGPSEGQAGENSNINIESSTNEFSKWFQMLSDYFYARPGRTGEASSPAQRCSQNPGGYGGEVGVEWDAYPFVTHYKERIAWGGAGYGTTKIPSSALMAIKDAMTVDNSSIVLVENYPMISLGGAGYGGTYDVVSSRPEQPKGGNGFFNIAGGGGAGGAYGSWTSYEESHFESVEPTKGQDGICVLFYQLEDDDEITN